MNCFQKAQFLKKNSRDLPEDHKKAPRLNVLVQPGGFFLCRLLLVPFASSVSGYFDSGMNLSATELMQYRFPVGFGPSSKRCPR